MSSIKIYGIKDVLNPINGPDESKGLFVGCAAHLVLNHPKQELAIQIGQLSCGLRLHRMGHAHSGALASSHFGLDLGLRLHALCLSCSPFCNKTPSNILTN